MKNSELVWEYTVIGASGFIGSNVVNYLESQGHNVLKVGRDLANYKEINLGTVVYCAGYGDCNKSPSNVVDANVTFLNQILIHCKYERIVYISSTRVYLEQNESLESANLNIVNDDNRRLFNITKLAAESLLEKYDNTVSLRVSNVYGDAYDSWLFLPSIVRDAVSLNHMNIYTTPDYSKDYININDVCHAIYLLSQKSNLLYKTYNVASGCNVTSKDIVDLIVEKTNCDVTWHSVNKEDHFPVISIERLKSEIAYTPTNLYDDLGGMINIFREKFNG